MGWKTSMILASSDAEINIEKLLNEMGMYQLNKFDSKSFDAIMNPDDNLVYIAKFKGNTVICVQDIPLESFNNHLSNAETVLSNTFPNSDVVSFALHSVVNLWGYSVVRNGKKIRARVGASETETVEFGEILPEEIELMDASRINENGQRIFKLGDHEYTDDQVGENFVYNLSAKYFGEAMNCSDDIFEAMFDGYSFSRSKPKTETPPKTKETIPHVQASSTPTTKKPWWKIW